MKFLIALVALVVATNATPISLLHRSSVWGSPLDLASPLRSTIIPQSILSSPLALTMPLRSTIIPQPILGSSLALTTPLRSAIIPQPILDPLITTRTTILEPTIANVPADTTLVTPFTKVGLATTGLVTDARSLVHSAPSLVI